MISVDTNALIADLSAMIRCPSTNSFGTADVETAEAAMADLFERQLLALGLEVGSHDVTPGRRNVWGILKGSGGGPTVLLAGHLDTVGVEGYAAPFEPVVKDGNIYGRGSCDMKAGLAAYLEVIRHFQRSGTKLAGDLIVAGLVDEEHAMIGSEFFGHNGPSVDCAIIAEPSELRICPVHKGQMLMTVRTRGLAVHSSLPDKGRNAIFHMTELLNGFRDYARELSQRAPHPLAGVPSFNVGIIRGGDNVCAVPDLCEIEIDRRTVPGETASQVMAEIQAILDHAKARIPEMEVEIDPPFLDVPPLDTPQDAPVMRAVKNACTTVTGNAPIDVFPGSTDAPNLRCPAVICGAGSLAQCHSLNEYVSIAQIEDAVRIYVHALLDLQNLSNTPQKDR